MTVRDGASGDDLEANRRSGPAPSGATRRAASETDQSSQKAGKVQSDLVEGWVKRLRSRKLTAIPIIACLVIAAGATIVDQVTGKSPLELFQQATEPEPSYEPPSEDEWRDIRSRPSPALAYRTVDSVYIAPAAQNPALLFKFAPATAGFNNNQLFWSPEGRYLGALLQTEAGGIAWYFDTVTGEQGDWQCECSGAAFVGSLLVALESTQASMKRFDLDANPTTAELDWPGKESASWSHVLTAAEDGLLVSAPTDLGGLTSAYGGPSSVYLVDLQGKANRLYELSGNTAVVTAAIAPGGRTLAVVNTHHLNACYESQEIVVVNAANGSERPISLPANEAWAVSSVSWDSAGDLYAAMLAFGSPLSDIDKPDFDYSCSGRAAGRVYVLKGASWSMIESPPIEATALSAGPNDSVAFIGPFESPDDAIESWGDLSVLMATDGNVQPLDDGVIEALWSDTRDDTEGALG